MLTEAKPKGVSCTTEKMPRGNDAGDGTELLIYKYQREV